MPPVAAAIAFFSVTLPTAIAGALAIPLVAAQAIVGLGISVGFSLLARALTPRQKPPGQQFEVKVGANVPFFTVYGRTKLGGLLLPPVQTATKVYHVRAFGIGEMDALEAIIVDGRRCRFEGIAGQWTDAGAVRQSAFGAVDWAGSPVNPGDTASGVATGDPPATPGLQGGASGSAWTNVLEFKRGSAARMRVKFYPGRQDQVADTTLPDVAQADAQGRKLWTSDHRLRGIAYVIVEIQPDSEVQLSAAPSLEFVVRGRKVLDPRKCTALGGTGSHDLADPATWEWSDNAALCHFDYRRGVRLGTTKVLGVGTPLARIHMPSVFAALAACDAPRALPDDASEPMWRLAAVIGNDRPHRDNLQIVYDTMAGAETEVGGTFRIRAGALETPVATITDSDLVKGPRRFRAQVPRMDRRNAVTGKYANPLKNYEIEDLPVRFSSEDEAIDGGERMTSELTLGHVPSATQGQHLMEIRRRAQRLTRSATITVPPRLRNPLVGEVISWQSARWHAGETYAYRIVSWRRNRNMTLTLGLAETSAGIWPWDPDEDQLSVLEAADLPSAAERLETAPGFAVVASSEAGDDGQVRPIFLVSWTPITDPTVKALLVRYRVVGSEAWQEQRFSGAAVLAAGEGKIVSGVQASTAYEFAYDLETLPTRVTEPAVLGAPVVASAEHVVRTAQTAVTVVPGAIDWDSFDEAFQERVEDVEQAAQDAFDEAGAVRTEALAAAAEALAAARAAADEVQDIVASLSGDLTRANEAGSRIGVTISQRISNLSQALASALAVSEDMRGALGDLGWERRGPGGASRFRAVDTINNGLTSLSTTVDLLAGRVDTIVAASGDGLGELEAELSVIRQTLDAVQGLYEALVVTVNGTTGSVASLEFRMGAVEGAITLLASQASLNAVVERLDAAEVQIASGTVTIETIAALRQSQSVASQTLAELLARFQALSDVQWEQAAATRFRLDSRIDANGQSIATLQIDLAALTQSTAATFSSLTQSIANATTAITTQINLLLAQVNSPTTGLAATRAQISTAAVAQATTNAALAALITALEAVVYTGSNSNTALSAAITAANTARANGDDALASSITSLDSRLTSAEGVNTSQGTAISALDTRVTAAEGTITSQSSSITSLNSGLTTANSNIASNTTAIATKADALALSALDTRVTATEGAITSQATDITALETAVNDPTTGLSTKASAASVTAVQSQADSQGTTLSSHASTLSTHTTEIGNNASAISSLASSKVDAAGAASIAQSEMESRFGVEGASGSIENAIADAVTLAGTKVDAAGATALAQTEVNAAIGDVTANGLFRVAAATTPSGATSAAKLLVKAADSGNYADAGIEMVAIAGGGGSPQGYLVLVGNRIYRRPSGGGDPILMVDSDGRFVGPSLTPGATIQVLPYERDVSTGYVNVGTGSTTGGGSNSWREEKIGEMSLIANTAAVIGGTGSIVPIQTTMELAVDMTINYMAALLTAPVLGIRMLARPVGGGSDVILMDRVVPVSSESYGSGTNNWYWRWGSNEADPKVSNSVRALPAGDYDIYLAWRWSYAPVSWADSAYTVRLSGNFAVFAFIR
ncbi:hypothetical protein [Phreatobacter sp.]|uniref:hypothetical protein n=1 Tax=Phreatobacter sp. TaxID=1966341 RepID=UPI003F719EFE